LKNEEDGVLDQDKTLDNVPKHNICLNKSPNILSIRNAEKLRWARHVALIEEMLFICSFYGEAKSTWSTENKITTWLIVIGCKNVKWMELIQDRFHCLVLVLALLILRLLLYEK
jgi:hypothetical protein